MKALLSEYQIIAIRMRLAGHTQQTIAKELGFSHVLISRWFGPSHLVGQCYRRFLDSGKLYAPESRKKSEPEDNSLQVRMGDAHGLWWRQRLAEIETEKDAILGEIPLRRHKDRTARYLDCVKILSAESPSWWRSWLTENSDWSQEEIERYIVS